MAFSDIKFIMFFVIVYALLWVIKCITKNKYSSISKIILLAASYIYILVSDWSCVIYILLLTIVTYLCGLKINSSKNKKIPAGIGIVFSILLLAIPKYSEIITSSVSKLVSGEIVTIDIMLPIGISFFTFSAIGYLIDVYRGKSEYQQSILDYSLYLAFFPKLVCGPLVKSKDFFPQLKDKTISVNLENLERGIQIFVLGVFKKLVLADHLNVFVNDVYNSPKAFSSFTVLLAVISYSLQLYFDFSGYSDMAIGVGKMLGYDFGKNFNFPYLSKNLTEFWKRWHISLSSWLQEYLYFSFGGNRKGKMRTYINLFLTMLIGGIWHGAGITFVIWGAFHGLGLIVHKKFMQFKEKRYGNKAAGGIVWNIVSVFLTFIYVSILWIFFRAESISIAIEIIKTIFSFSDGISQIYTWSIFAIAVTIIYAVFALIKQKTNKEKSVDYIYPVFKLSTVKGLLIFIVFTGLTICLAYFGNTAFIYGKF